MLSKKKNYYSISRINGTKKICSIFSLTFHMCFLHEGLQNSHAVAVQAVHGSGVKAAEAQFRQRKF